MITAIFLLCAVATGIVLAETVEEASPKLARVAAEARRTAWLEANA